MGKKKTIWEKEAYYKKARQGSLDTSHPGMKTLKRLSKNATIILDLGCGEGTRLSWLVKNTSKKGVGVDISKKAISLAKKTHPRLKFVEGNLERLDFKDGSFDLVYSAYVLEHLDNAENMIEEAIRVSKKDGYLVFIAPNFGAPNRVSPLNNQNRVVKLVVGFISDISVLIRKPGKLSWKKLDFKLNIEDYDTDFDTTLEPYLGTLIEFLKSNNIKIEKAISCWDQELPGAGLMQKVFKSIGKLGLFPFWMWGPHIVITGKKH